MRQRLVLFLLCVCCWSTLAAQQPVVAIHVSELTQHLEVKTAGPATPSGSGTTGKEWWTPWWHYFVMHESVEEALRSDGTPYVLVTDADIRNEGLIIKGVPKYPIVISLANEAIDDNEIAPLLDYVASGGFLIVGSSAFTRKPDGTSRGDFALANAMGLHTAGSTLQNWSKNSTFTKALNHRLIEDIPPGTLEWTMPLTADDISWGISVARKGPPGHTIQKEHYIWRTKADSATVLATTSENLPYIAIRRYGKGYFIYDAAMQPLIGNGGWAPGMYAYGLFRSAIEWAFDSAGLPIIKVSPWPYQYNAAYMVRHDFENTQSSIRAIEASAKFDRSLGARGDYYFCTGTLRQEMENSQEVVDSLRRAVRVYGATIGSHNGGLPNAGNSALQTSDRDYWHWGPDEALDTHPASYRDGSDYAAKSLNKSLDDIAGWMQGVDTNTRTYSAPYFNATREDSYELLAHSGIETAGEQKLTPFPHWTVSTRVPGKRFPFLTLPVSDWYVGSQLAQSMEVGHTPSTIHELVDRYYQLGALLNLYTHKPSTEPIPSEYVRYASSKAHVWPTNASTILEWWKHRSKMYINPSLAEVGKELTIVADVTGAEDPDSSLEVVIPEAISPTDVRVRLNGMEASPNTYRAVGRGIKIHVDRTISAVEISYPHPAAAKVRTVANEHRWTAPPSHSSPIRKGISFVRSTFDNRIFRIAGGTTLLLLLVVWGYKLRYSRSAA